MINSMYSLDHRLAELRPSESDLRIARQLRDAAAPAIRPARSIGEPTRKWATANVISSHLTRLAAI